MAEPVPAAVAFRDVHEPADAERRDAADHLIVKHTVRPAERARIRSAVGTGPAPGRQVFDGLDQAYGAG